MFSRLLVAYDGSEASRRALDAAIELASRLGAELFSISAEEGIVVPSKIPGYGPAESDEPTESTQLAERKLFSLSEQVHEIASRNGVSITTSVASGDDEIDAILSAITTFRCDLLIVGLRHHAGIIDRLFPHTAMALEERAPCSVLGVR